MSPSMIFHYPRPIKAEISGSQVHISQMLKAFRQLGYQIEMVTGYARERAATFKRLQREATMGRRFDFLYAWSPTMPTLLSRRNFYRPFLDLRLFAWCRAQAIPVGLFYGDVHWRFPHYKSAAPWLWRTVAIPFYWYDWLSYRWLVDRLFLPSLQMLNALPTGWRRRRVSALAPGCNIVPLPPRSPKAPDELLELFYVGGVTPPLYDLKPMFDVLKDLDHVHLTVCCRQEEWEKNASYYSPLHGDHIRIVHAHGEELRRYYAAADLFGLFWQPNPYLNVTMPVKVFESIGYGVPIATTRGTEVARFVEREQVGWVVASADEFCELLVRLQADGRILADMRRRVAVVRERNTWEARAQMIADILQATRERSPGESRGGTGTWPNV